MNNINIMIENHISSGKLKNHPVSHKIVWGSNFHIEKKEKKIFPFFQFPFDLDPKNDEIITILSK